ncbi:MAG: hypothetical protein NZ602_04275 [Thermoguttaceae bacterium]|nr:hypothetical protein [Thermoguttaceae bacterium]
MESKWIDVKEAQARLPELISQMGSDQEWIIMDGSLPIAKIISINLRSPGLHPGAVWTSADFDEPLPDEFWADNS